MARSPRALAATICVLSGCATTIRDPMAIRSPGERPPSPSLARAPADDPPEAALGAVPTIDDYVGYALAHNPGVEAARQRWRAAAERVPQVRALPDPQLTVGVFAEEVQTRTGPQQARVGVRQTFPWPGVLRNREDAASREALAAWREYEAARLALIERVTAALAELAYLDAATRVTRQTLGLVRSFERVVRARYRVGAGSHPELIRAQVELGLLEDRVATLESLRPALVAELNAALGRAGADTAPAAPPPSDRVVTDSADALAALAREANPRILALIERAEAERALVRAARAGGYPDVTLGAEYIVTGEAVAPGVPGSGDDPVLVTLGVTLPLWREKERAAVREATARRLEQVGRREDESNRIDAAVRRAHFEHTDADRRARLYEDTLIPKAEESLGASLAAFRAGDAAFLDVLDAERTFLEYALIAQRARADRAIALARLDALTAGAVSAPAAETSP
ncbi:MAG: TolC family protein [Planctomycetota bacterium]|nr:MAG: TolC family protein [Planctomycetota bacterium]